MEMDERRCWTLKGEARENSVENLIFKWNIDKTDRKAQWKSIFEWILRIESMRLTKKKASECQYEAE